MVMGGSFEDEPIGEQDGPFDEGAPSMALKRREEELERKEEELKRKERELPTQGLFPSPRPLTEVTEEDVSLSPAEEKAAMDLIKTMDSPTLRNFILALARFDLPTPTQGRLLTFAKSVQREKSRIRRIPEPKVPSVLRRIVQRSAEGIRTLPESEFPETAAEGFQGGDFGNPLAGGFDALDVEFNPFDDSFNVPGISVFGSLRRSNGEEGLRIGWGDETIDWFPEEN